MRIATLSLIVVALVASCGRGVVGQSVGLPAPRLLNTTPMGGKVGATVDVVISGQFLEDVAELTFSDPRLTATAKLDAEGKPVADTYVVSIAADCPEGVYDARVMTRLGLSTSRAFSVGRYDEVSPSRPVVRLDAAMAIPVNCVVNGATTPRSVDHYAFEAKQGQRVIVDCAARGIDSKLDPTVVVADSTGRDLVVERRGGAIDFVAPVDGKYVVKIHDLTFRGGNECFYRLGVWEQPPGTPVARQASTRIVGAMSWPPVSADPAVAVAAGSPEATATPETEPNDDAEHAQRIALPCDIAGAFAQAADVDVFEFEAKKGDEWWVEIASERFGLPTDPAIVVQHVAKTDAGETITDVAELGDIASPMRVSSNGYAYDGPPYNAGSSDAMGKFVAQQDGLHRLRVSDSFGGTRTEPRNVYRLVVRKANPDFALACWGLHMELRNGDRAALSKPVALRGGATMALEVVAIRRDGFDGEIELGMEGLPEGVTAHGVKIPAGQTRGMILVTAKADAPRGFASAKCFGKATINGQPASRPCQMASYAWPIPDSWGEIPYPRLLADVPVSVSGVDQAPLSLAAATPVIEATAGQKIVVPFEHVRRSEFSGGTFQFRAVGVGFERVPAFDIKLSAEKSEATIDLAALNTQPGDHVVAFLGGTVAKYRHNVGRLKPAEDAKDQAAKNVSALEAEAKRLGDAAAVAGADQKAEADRAADAAKAKLKSAQDALAAATDQLNKVAAMAQPQDIVDIVVSDPVVIRVKPAETK